METETSPAFEVHLGEITQLAITRRSRFCIVWINGKRWEGHLHLVTEGGE